MVLASQTQSFVTSCEGGKIVRQKSLKCVCFLYEFSLVLKIFSLILTPVSEKVTCIHIRGRVSVGAVGAAAPTVFVEE